MNSIISEIEDYIKRIISVPHTLNHHLRTRDYLLILDPKVSLEAQIAALTHDLERQFPNKLPDPESFEDREYLLTHGQASAKIVADYLKSKKVKIDYEKLEHLISYHELGGDYESDLIRDADSLSFLEITAPNFVKKRSSEKSREKFDFMFNRIKNQKAKILAKPVYRKALKLLN